MLDIQQIKISTQHTLAVLKHIHSIDGVQLVTDFFDQALLDKLLEYCQTTSQWQPVYDLEQKEIVGKKLPGKQTQWLRWHTLCYKILLHSWKKHSTNN